MLIDPVRRMMEGQRIGVNIWPEKNVNMQPFVVQIMNGENYGQVSTKAKDATGKNILELSVQSGLLHFTKVLIYFLIINGLIKVTCLFFFRNY